MEEADPKAEPDTKAEADPKAEPDKEAPLDGETELLAPVVITSSFEAPVIFVDNLYHLTWSDNVAKLAFVQYLGDPPGPGEGDSQLLKGRHVVALAMSFEAMIRMSDDLQTSIAFMREHGPLK